MWRQIARQAASATRRSARSSSRLLANECTSHLKQPCLKSSNNGWSTWGPLSFASAVAAIGLAPVAFADAVDEKSFIMIKPDGVQRGLVADIIKRFESKGYKLVAIKMIKPSEDLAKQHYEEHTGKPFFTGLVGFLSSGPVVAMVWEGKEVIKTGRGLIGSTCPLASAPGSIRGDYGIDVGRNIIHGSDSVDSAQKEIALWFKPSELTDYQQTMTSWVYESKL